MKSETEATQDRLVAILREVSSGHRSIESALQEIQIPTGLRSTDHATTDLDRLRRRGIPEVIYGEGKTAEQIVEILRVLEAENQAGLVTRTTPAQQRLIQEHFPGALVDLLDLSSLRHNRPSPVLRLGTKKTAHPMHSG